ncbi:MAG: DUF4235 domain-containing protein [Mobiluncus porci]|uniref:DUF4235 domain-containing protein n=1 Tax=Mobiluncus porci TaxID=2652278 RepID=A0A7K0K465_9ACTO|nr:MULTISPECIES: DUF4235 domain-containing protein [Mobiluncus]MCI6584729.1 DUF4235 domain-containing protein [Mobiluncus sp.]MDD7542556.1 DUF4235 domain-containing protein [Mobiluncus porci]MDY5747908.1 DUF4235 domain-containing protein [Mobiluncus porci]MST50273.1 DUF4235 domain-containing protein [Mobiluncus porci]
MDIGWKVVDLGALAVAGLLSDNIVKIGWKLATGSNPPKDDDLEVGIAELLVFTVLSGVLLTFTKRFTVKTASKWYGKKHPAPTEV